MENLDKKNSKTLTSNDIESLTQYFAGKHEDYIEIVNSQQNTKTINKYPLLREINSALTCTQLTGNNEECKESLSKE
jgi:hypothetical protein